MNDDFRSLALGPPERNSNAVWRELWWNEFLMRNGEFVRRPPNPEANEIGSHGRVVRNPLKVNGVVYTEGVRRTYLYWDRKTGKFMGVYPGLEPPLPEEVKLAMLAFVETYMGLHNFEFPW